MNSEPMLMLSSLNCTPATPTLSDAVAETATVPDTELFAAGAVIDTVGGGGSGGGSGREVKLADTAGFPAALLGLTRHGDRGAGASTPSSIDRGAAKLLAVT